VLQIPIGSNEPHFTQETELFGEVYNFEFEWIEREQMWLMHMYNEEQTPILLGQRLMPNIAYRISALQLVLLSNRDGGVKLELRNLRSDFSLVAHATI